MEHILFNVVFVRHMATSLLFACMKWNYSVWMRLYILKENNEK